MFSYCIIIFVIIFAGRGEIVRLHPLLVKIVFKLEVLRTCSRIQFWIIISHVDCCFCCCFPDIHHRILRWKNYMIAMQNKSVISGSYSFPFVGER